jgi:hypothetical protein
MSTVSFKNEATDVAARLAIVLQGRDLYPWGYTVGLNRSAIYRLSKGDLPDPETLIPACRIERLSLSWLLDGIGTPFCVIPADSDASGARYIEDRLREESALNVTLVHSDRGFCVVLSQRVHVEPAGGFAYSYVALEVVGGGALGPTTMHAVMDSDVWPRMSAVDAPTSDWGALAAGHLGNLPLLGPDLWRAEEGVRLGLLGQAKRIWRNSTEFQSIRKVEEARSIYGTTMSAEEIELLHIFRGLDERDRETVLKMMRALRR